MTWAIPKGEYVPDLTVQHEIVDKTTGPGCCIRNMQMNANDGPHYGANVKLDKAGSV